MKLVIATPLYPPEIGGPATYAKILYEGLPQRGIEVALVKFGDVRHLPKLIRHYVYYRRVLKAARQSDAILALDPVSTGLPAMKAAQKAKKPFVVKIAGDYAWEQGKQRFGIAAELDDFVRTEAESFPVRTLQRVQARVAAVATRVIVPSEYLKEIIVAWGIPEKNIEVIYNAVSVETSASTPEVVTSLPRPLIVSAGRLVPWKHFDGVIDAVASLRVQGILASLVIVGDGPLRAQIEDYAQDKLGDSCVILGMLPHADTLAVMRSADVCVLNSSYEGLSHLLIEALTLRIPIVATRVGGNEEVVVDGEDGLLVPNGDTEALAHALARILTDAILRNRMNEHAGVSARRFSTDAMLTATARLLKSV